MLKLEDIYVGMKVNPRDLSKIYHTLIILSNFEGHIGEIMYIGEPDTKESNSIYRSLHEICTVYNYTDEEEISFGR